MRSTLRLTVAQALVRFLGAQYSERDGVEHRLVEGCFGIFGHGNLAGVGEALLEEELRRPGRLPYWTGRNEQGMVHAAVGYARMRNRLSALACTASVGPGATNMVTGAALATINRIPVLLLPGDVFATRAASPSPCCSCPATCSPPEPRPRCCRSSSSQRAGTSRSTTRSARCRSTSTGCGAPSSCPRRCWLR